MPSFLPDTTCMISTVSSWHEHHERARREIEKRLGRGQGMVVAATALVECYSVLTRLPAPHRVSPVEAWQLLETNFGSRVKVIALSSPAYCALLGTAPDAGTSGGRIYDAVIAECARKAKVETLLTFNEAHFASFSGSDLKIVVP